MDYKQKYEQALERARKVHTTNVDENKKSTEYIFPELKESGDERIRKALIQHIRYKVSVISGWRKEELIAWLEKVAVPSPQDWNDYKDKPVELWNAYVRGLANGEEVGKNAVKNRPSDYGLEKQGKQKSTEIHPIFRVGDYIKNKKTNNKVLIEQLDVKSKAYCYTSYDGAAVIHSDFPFSKQDEWELIGQKIVEQNQTDKAEQKFKVGDIIVNEYGFIMQIDGIDGNMYGCHVLDGNILLKHDIAKTDESCHLWTIQDAKDGDVLTDSNHPCIFKSINEENVLLAYCGINDKGNFATESESEDNVWDDNPEKYSPATKEQRDLLFQKMKEAGYEWDAEKKELKKIELKPAWSEDDERYYNSALWHIKNSCSNGRITSGEGEVYHWLKSLKQRMKGE